MQTGELQYNLMKCSWASIFSAVIPSESGIPIPRFLIVILSEHETHLMGLSLK